MEVEKKRSKGGFFHLFDWNGKSRKKLFANNFEPSNQLKQGQPMGSCAKLQPQMIEVDTYRANLSNRASSDFNPSSSSSVTSDEGNGSRALGVVARLMGLDTLPVPNVPDPCCESYFGSHSLRASYCERNVPNMWNESQAKDYSHILNKFDSISSNSVQSSFHKAPNRPFERFQTEVLPPKSAKSIPITHHKLLSPIRSPGVIAIKNADYIMEAATRIIEASPQTSKAASWSSSVPLRIRGLKEKMEAAHRASRPQRPEELIADKFARGNSSDKLGNGVSDRTPAFRMTRESKRVGSDSMGNAKSISLAMQAKVNVQRKGETTSSSNLNSASPKESADVKAKRSSKSQADVKRTIDKGAAANCPNNVLKQNNRKQNCTSNRDSSTSKSPCTDQQSRNKSPSAIVGSNSTVDKGSVKSENGSKKSVSVAAELKKTALPSRRNSLPGKKRSVNGDLKSKGSVSDISNSHVKRSINCNVSTNQCVNPADERMKKGMDVVSFTFTTPMIRPPPDSQSSGRSKERSCSFVPDSSSDIDQSFMRSSALSSSGLSLIGGDALSILLEQKLQELSFKIESSGCNVIRGSTTSLESSLRDSVTTPSTGLASAEHDTGLQLDLDMNKSCRQDDNDCPLVDNLELARNSENPQSEMEELDASSMNSMTGIELHYEHTTPVSIFEPSVGSESCLNSQNGGNGCMQLSPAQDQETISLAPTNEPRAEDGREKTVGPISFAVSSEQEFDYMKSILNNAKLMFTDFALAKTDKVISSSLFDELESQEITGERNEETSKLCRKLLFDSLSECLDLRCGELFVGTMKGWAKFAGFFQQREWLAKELFKEIEGWKNMGEIMVDELVEKDMGNQHGRWLNFDVEAFEEGLDIGNVILTSLVDELVSDLLDFYAQG